jgi:hypothetical protein
MKDPPLGSCAMLSSSVGPEVMHGHAMFAMDDSFTNMEFKTHPDTLVHDSFDLLVETLALSSH